MRSAEREAGLLPMKYNMSGIDWLKYGTLMEHGTVHVGARESSALPYSTRFFESIGAFLLTSKATCGAL